MVISYYILFKEYIVCTTYCNLDQIHTIPEPGNIRVKILPPSVAERDMTRFKIRFQLPIDLRKLKSIKSIVVKVYNNRNIILYLL